MAEMELNALTALPTATGWIARATYARCVKKGIKADTLLRKAGLTPPQIDHSELRIPYDARSNFVDLAARALSDDLLGFHLAKTADLREIGLLYYVMASSELLGEAPVREMVVIEVLEAVEDWFYRRYWGGRYQLPSTW